MLEEDDEITISFTEKSERGIEKKSDGESTDEAPLLLYNLSQPIIENPVNDEINVPEAVMQNKLPPYFKAFLESPQIYTNSLFIYPPVSNQFQGHARFVQGFGRNPYLHNTF